ncbi:unnamed protein product [Trichogramma brassicae]|uniref:Uncharacterized protein n=1 Tax=Trichogramma brassicae TaxID=86971 RepID=A0A6H5IS79_9HYME|nr:unnamed protein product [Trichogramma brassicae]
MLLHVQVVEENVQIICLDKNDDQKDRDLNNNKSSIKQTEIRYNESEIDENDDSPKQTSSNENFPTPCTRDHTHRGKLGAEINSCESAHLPLSVCHTGCRSKFSEIKEPNKVRECCVSKKPKLGSDMSSRAIFQAEIERVLKYVDMTNDKMLDKMFEMMNRLMNKVEGLCTSVRELDLRVSEQEAKSSAPVSPIKEDLENVKISTAKCSEFISRIPSIIAPYSATDQCEMLLSGVPSGLELSDNQVLKKTFSAMGMNTPRAVHNEDSKLETEEFTLC